MMTEQASFTLRNRNPDVLTCIANLSNDEVFTPPDLANQMLDMLAEAWAKDHNGENIWENKNVKFLDPCTKSGVFLREITSRLTKGLEKKIPNLKKRVDHILSKQVYGLGITKLTSLLARRSVYCSKNADGVHSIAKSLKSKDGNIWYENISHTWLGDRCKYCGASKFVFDRGEEFKKNAYAFIHTENIDRQIEKIFGAKMQFDVIIGNPPYQLNDGGGMGTSATPIYQMFIQQAKNLNPRFISMVIPSRWFSGGKGLDEFREQMLNDKRVSKIVDYFDSRECFPGVDISGGVCFFLWNSESTGDCEVVSRRNRNESIMVRPLLESDSDSFIRFNEAISIVRKAKGKSLETIVSPRRPFGIRADVPIKEKSFENSIKIYSYPKNGFIAKNEIEKNLEWTKKYKVYISKAYGERGSFPYLVIGKPFIGEKQSVCSETYLVVGPFDTESEAKNAIEYLKTKFVRFLILLKKNTQNAAKGVYSFVPIQNFTESWSDEKLQKKYGLTDSEVSFINSMIRPMEESSGE